MHDPFEKRIEDGLNEIAASCTRGKQDMGSISRRIGKLLGQNSRTAGLFEVQVISDGQGVTKVDWKKVAKWRSWAQLSRGAYVLRSNVPN